LPAKARGEIAFSGTRFSLHPRFLSHPFSKLCHLIDQELRVHRFVGTRSLVSVLLLIAALTPAVLAAERGSVSNPQPPTYILVGFVGGFLRHDNAHHNPVKVARLLQQNSPKDAYIEVFENRHRKTALKTILRLLDANHDGVLSDDEKASAHIMLVGHSWGGSATVILARELNRVGIPVMLTVQVDSVAKPWQNDAVIPENVAAAVNFYQPHGIIHGRSTIKAADDSKTRILGTYRFDYRQTPVRCEGYSWFDRIITPSHMQAECDPHIWTQVENLVRERMTPEPSRLAANPAP
jgi:pimeloyl-ACP methyl ester carboxylesterase